MTSRVTALLGVSLCLNTMPAYGIDYDSFHSQIEIRGLVTGLVASHPTIARLVPIGPSRNGTELVVLKISDNVNIDEPDEGDVVFFAMQHAREWMAAETALFLAEHLLTEYGSNPRITADVDNVQIWILLDGNPDGYAHTQSADRCWRKNRRDNGDGTFGVDLNRNWSFQFGGPGSSDVTGALRYRGPYPFSEPESRAKRDFLQGLSNFKALFNYHSYSTAYLRPWSYTFDDPPGEATLRALFERSRDLIQDVHGEVYTPTIVPAQENAGVMTDWIWNELRAAPLTPELRPATRLTDPAFPLCGGFAPPETEILPNIQENLPAALGLIHDAAGREVWIRDHPSDSGTEPSARWLGDRWSQPFWISPDITTQPEELDQGDVVELRIRVHNNSGQLKRNVRVDAYFTDPRISLEFPNPDAQMIGSQTVNVPPGGRTVTMAWTVPIGGNSWGELHWCVGAIVMHETDLPLTTEAQRSSNIAIKNFTTSADLAADTLVVAATNFLAVDAELIVTVDQDSIPPGWQVTVPPPPEIVGNTPIKRKARLLGATGRLLAPQETIYIPVHVEPPEGVPSGTAVNVDVHAGLRPLVAGERTTLGNGFTYRVTTP